MTLDTEPAGAFDFDEQKIGQVIRNLLSNAIKFSPDNKVVSIVAKRCDTTVVVSVSDEGPGIPENELEAVFDKFAQSSRTKTGAGGTGLGLSICREIVDAHGGRIWATTGGDGGACVQFELPRSQDQTIGLPLAS